LTDRTSPGDPEIGSLAEEATKLFGALAGLAREHGVGPGSGQAAGNGHPDATAGATADDTVDQAEEHLATGASECTVCPLCRTVHAVRGLSPEVRAHLSTAVSSLVQAAGAFLSTQPPGPGDAEESRRDDDDQLEVTDDSDA